MPTEQPDSEFQDLWSRRDTLSQQEWRRLYELTCQILRANTGRFQELRSLPETLDVYVEDFFTRKVFEPVTREGYQRTPIHAGAINVYFQRFLRDRLDDIRRRPPPPDGGEQADFDIFALLDDSAWHPHVDWEWELWEAGLSIPAVTAAARRFIASLEPLDRLLLKCGFAGRMPLDRFRTIIKNPYYPASRLGIARNLTAVPDYRATRIGAWLTHPGDGQPPGLGFRLDADYREALAVALQILRQQALLEDIDCRQALGQSVDDPA